MNTKQNIYAKAALFFAALIWGTSFVIMKNSVDIFPPPVLLGIRFAIGTLLLSLIFNIKLRLLNKDYLIKGGIIGLMLFIAYYSQTWGLTDTTPGKNAFLTAAYCVMVPFLMWITAKKKPDAYNVVAAFLCLTGIGLVSLTEGFSISFGDSFTLLGAFFYAAHMVVIAIFSKDKDPVLLTILQFGTSAVLAWIVALFTAEFPTNVPASAWFSLCYLGIFCTGIAMLLQNVGQKYSDASSASIILSLEAVFGVTISILCGTENVTLNMAIGFVLIFISVIISETKLSFLNKNKSSDNV